LLEVLKNNGKGCIVYSPLAQGVLSDKYLHSIPPDSRAGKKHGFLKPDQVTAEKVDKVKMLKDIADGRGQSIAQLAIAWILRNKSITSVLVGASTIKQIKENIDSLSNIEFSVDELSRIENGLQ